MPERPGPDLPEKPGPESCLMNYIATPPAPGFSRYVRLHLASRRRRDGSEFGAHLLLGKCIKAALACTAAATKNETNTILRARLKKRFNEDAIIELTSPIAFQNLSGKFNLALDFTPVVMQYPAVAEYQG